MIGLNSNQKKLLDFFATTSLIKKFYLTGGTALSFFYLHHRLSIDLDFFSDTRFEFKDLENFLNKVKKAFRLKEIPEKDIK